VLGLRVFDHIVDCFLGDAIERLLHLTGQGALAADAQIHGQVVAFLHHIHIPPQGRFQILLSQRGRAQLIDERAHLGQRVLGDLLQALDLLERAVRVRVDQGAGRLGVEHDTEQRLGHRVVQLAGQPGALLHDGQVAALLI